MIKKKMNDTDKIIIIVIFIFVSKHASIIPGHKNVLLFFLKIEIHRTDENRMETDKMFDR